MLLIGMSETPFFLRQQIEPIGRNGHVKIARRNGEELGGPDRYFQQRDAGADFADVKSVQIHCNMAVKRNGEFEKSGRRQNAPCASASVARRVDLLRARVSTRDNQTNERRP
jgi:hypothetical protein